LQVYQLHFEENKSAVEIAEILNFNRNTINADIQFWYSQLVNKSNGLDLNTKMTKQIQRMEIQRDRLFDYLEEAETLDNKIRLEKLVSDIDNRLGQFYSKAIFSGKEILQPSINFKDIESEKINDGKIRKIARTIYYENRTANNDNDVFYVIIDITKCDLQEAENLLGRMKILGLDLCRNSTYNYDFEMFVRLRDFVDPEEIRKEDKKIQDEFRKEDEKYDKWERNFFSKNGSDKSKWSEKIWDEYNDYD